MLTERAATFSAGGLFFRPASRIVRDLGVLALSVLATSRPSDAPPLRVLDAMAGTGVRSLRYSLEGDPACSIHANELMSGGTNPLRQNLEPISDRCDVTADDAVDVYMKARLGGADAMYDFVDADGFGTGQPHVAEAWWAVRNGGLLYLCGTDSCTTAGQNPFKAVAGYAAVAQYFPACNEQGVRLLIGTAFREAAARNLHAEPLFGYFHRPSSTMRVMMRLKKAKRPPAHAFDALTHVARCPASAELWRVPSGELGAAAALKPGGAAADAPPPQVFGPLWDGPMHDVSFVRAMRRDAEARGWDDAADLLGAMAAEAEADAGGALLFHHLGDVQRALAAEGFVLPPRSLLLAWLHAAGFSAAPSHIEGKGLKTSASLAELVAVVAARRDRGDESVELASELV